MLRDTSAARTSNRSVTWARAPSGKASRAASMTAERADFVRDLLDIERKDKPTGSIVEESRRGPAATPYRWRGEFADAYRPDPLVDRHRAPRDQGDHRRGRPLGRAPAGLDRPSHRLYPAHLGL